VTATEARPTAVRTQPNVFTWYFFFTRSTAKRCNPVEPYTLAQRRGNFGEARRSGNQKFGNETGRRHLGVALSVMKYTWDGRVIRIRKAVTRFRNGGSQMRPFGRRDGTFDGRSATCNI
jgi:hypothetical protein